MSRSLKAPAWIICFGWFTELFLQAIGDQSGALFFREKKKSVSRSGYKHNELPLQAKQQNYSCKKHFKYWANEATARQGRPTPTNACWTLLTFADDLWLLSTAAATI